MSCKIVNLLFKTLLTLKASQSALFRFEIGFIAKFCVYLVGAEEGASSWNSLPIPNSYDIGDIPKEILKILTDHEKYTILKNHFVPDEKCFQKDIKTWM